MVNAHSVRPLLKYQTIRNLHITSPTDGDPTFTSNVSALEMYYLTEPVIESLRKKILDNHTYPVPYYDPNNYTVLNDHGTSHMAVIHKSGMAVSLTTTVNGLPYGQRIYLSVVS
jgi:gamma-glutamyltranspeptidase